VQQAANLKSLDPLLYCNEIAADFKVFNQHKIVCVWHKRLNFDVLSVSHMIDIS